MKFGEIKVLEPQYGLKNNRAHSRLVPVIDAAHTVKRRWEGILRWFDSKIANGPIEGNYSLVQATKSKACGHRSPRQPQGMVCLLTGKLDIRLPEQVSSTHHK